ncbi:MAG: dipeptidase [Gammaproteobacteria bacterium]
MLAKILTVALIALAGSTVPADQATHNALFTIDSHVDVPRIDEAEDIGDLAQPDAQVDIRKMREGGLDAAFFILFSMQGDLTPAGQVAAREEALARYRTIRRMLDRHPDQIELARSAADAQRIHAAGKLVAFLGMENAYPLGGDPANLQQYYNLGVRYLGITHMGHNKLGDSADPRRSAGETETLHGGLTDAGRAVVAEANRLGIMVDVSHAHRTTAIQIARASTAPVIASHSAIRALTDISRNMDDEQLLAVKATGGVVQIVAFSSYLKLSPPERTAAILSLAAEVGLTGGKHDPDALPPDMREKYLAERKAIDDKWPKVNATVADFVDHIDYAVRLLGIDHVGIASDFGGGGGIEGWRNAAETPNVTRELLARGYDTDDLQKLWGGNLLRVMTAVQAKARTAAP